MADLLPIYRLVNAESDYSQSIEFSHRLFGIRNDFNLSKADNRVVLKNDLFNVEIGNGSQDIWAADTSQLWNPSLRPQILKGREALAEARKIVEVKKLLPQLNGPFKYGEPHLGGTFFAQSENKKRTDHQLDTQVIFPILAHGYPIVGGGGDFTLTLGDKGKITGFSGSWTQPKESFNAEVMDKKLVDRQFMDLTKSLNLSSFESYLAYYAGPAFSNQPYLYPVYVYRATAKLADRVIPLRNIIIPATTFGPRAPRDIPQKKRNPRTAPRQIEEKDKLRRSYNSAALFSNPFEAGSSWIGLSGGLSGSQSNAKGFIDEWRAAGWNINFNWGDANAFESDWRRNDDTWVDAVDFVFYTGHADMNGWILATPDDGSLSYTEVGNSPQSPGDLWGQNDLEWAIIAACGPLQDSLLAAGGGNVLDRWDGAFDGMHILMGYGGITFDNTDEGKRVSQYAKQGNTLINSWFRAAKEIQPSTNGATAPNGPDIYVGAMWAGRAGIDPVNDHAWGYGSVSEDPTNPTFLAAMWTIC
ncbi:DUF6345 domain-containing protein [Dyadobacter sp. 3J3]|uniref:DUF6345 domain-containing protein n=1 Tax=Dyadobacter sp. 3J3 TaxID=2606600 RepID=UPI00135C73D0|nr:DUF6345 domain-containing protein [Dyadobacter sp. 3J3]